MMADERPLGEVVSWTPARVPGREELRGRTVALVPLDVERDVASLYRVSHAPDGDPSVWTYLSVGPFADEGELGARLAEGVAGDDPLWFSVVPAEMGMAIGLVTYLRIDAEMGSIEIGNIMFGPGLRRTTAATEAIFLLARHAFEELGYRRFEWKCNALNAASRRAAERFGFTFEGIFRQHMVVKGRNRDTAWLSITDREWPRIRAGFEAFLDPDNFDAQGRQRRPLAELISAVP
jgi:RimJ/RimL family protein N-acetyltransferase